MELIIGGRPYTVNHQDQTLEDVERDSKIPFSAMEPAGSHMLFLYDTNTHELFDGDWSKKANGQGIEMIRIPASDRLMAMDQGKLPPEKAWVLPKVDVHTETFFVDVVQQELRQADNPANRISFRSMTDFTAHIELIYDRETKNAFKGTFADYIRDDNAMIVNLPPITRLDPPMMLEIMKPTAFHERRETEDRMNRALDQALGTNHANDFARVHNQASTRLKEPTIKKQNQKRGRSRL
jgi:hypothetical protein